MIYFVYKNIQGVHPKDNRVAIGIATNGDYTVGSVEDIDSLDMVREFNPIIIPESMVRGIQKINIIDGESVDKNNQIIVLTEDELQSQKEAKIFFKKLEIRKNIQNAIGDTEDQLADVSKRLALLERLTVRILLPIMKGEDIPADLITAYQPMLESIITNIDTGVAKDRVDLEDPTTQMNDIMTKSTQISNIVEEYIVYKTTL